MQLLANFFGTVLKSIYMFVGNYGLAIILFTIIVKILLTPLTVKQTKSTFAMSEINPKIKEIQEKYKNNPEKQNEEVAKLYKESGFNPFAGCLPLLIQMPILFALFWVFKDPMKYGVFINKAQMMAANGSFLWVHSLTRPDYILAVVSGVSAFVMQKVMTPEDQLQGAMKSMTWVMTGMSLFWGFTFPAALTLYWSVSNIVSAVQYIVITKPLKAKLEREKQERLNAKSGKGAKVKAKAKTK